MKEYSGDEAALIQGFLDDVMVWEKPMSLDYLSELLLERTETVTIDLNQEEG